MRVDLASVVGDALRLMAEGGSVSWTGVGPIRLFLFAECSVCMLKDAARCYALCGHVAVCLDCAVELVSTAFRSRREAKCPICRKGTGNTFMVVEPGLSMEGDDQE